MSASVSRQLIDHKDDRSTGNYGGMIQTGALVLLLQGAIVLVGCAVVVFLGTSLLHVDLDLERSFKIVMFAQCGIIAADFPVRLFNHLLVAHQRADITNYSQIGFFVASYAVLWSCFARGWGILSLVWANLAGWSVVAVANVIACSSLGLFPSQGEWGRANWNKFRELFAFGKDIFWIALGTQMINASQAVVITRTLGLNAAAIWSVSTRSFTLANQLAWRPFDFSGPMLSEMVVRNEKARLLHRFRNLVVLTTSLSILAASLFALCNRPFVILWTRGSIGWSIQNNVLLAIWMVILSLVHCHCGLVNITKRIAFMRYVYFIEGAAFLGIGSIVAARTGFAGMLLTSIFASLLFSFSYGIWRTMMEFNVTLKEVMIDWLVPPFKLALSLSVFGLLVYWPTQNVPPEIQLPLYAFVVGTVAAFLFFRYGLESQLREEFRQRMPTRIARLLERFFQAC
jgi:O-antigen/teichoic acid export membrane protein